MPADRLAVALAGAGRWGSRILSDLVAQGARVFAADPDADARVRAMDLGAEGVSSDVGGLPPVDAAVVAAPTLLHGAVIEALVSRGIPLFCEKPLSADAAEAATLARRHARLFVLDKWRYHPAVEELARIARTGALGPARALRTRRVQPSISGYDVDPTWVLAPHEISIAMEVLGEVPPLASARAERREGALTALAAEFVAGTTFAFEVSTTAPLRRREITLECRDGVARWSDADPHAVDVGGRRVAVSSEPPLAREVRALLACAAGGAPLKTDGRAGAAAVALIDAARKAAAILDRPAR